MKEDRIKVTAEVWGLRVRNLFYTVVQLTGFALVAYGIYSFFSPFLRLYGYSVSLPTEISGVLPGLGLFEGVAVMFAGFVVVWLSTASWF
ncbi:hypothetical protein [Halorussus salinisoli]|uniref:hypothetical protein n=1 Tax=Halorussus salinisoli TaxID=2558242 RepID=UPI0010C2280A|nr:hypothetical protein [Halorussus salinisoli]